MSYHDMTQVAFELFDDPFEKFMGLGPKRFDPAQFHINGIGLKSCPFAGSCPVSAEKAVAKAPIRIARKSAAAMDMSVVFFVSIGIYFWGHA